MILYVFDLKFYLTLILLISSLNSVENLINSANCGIKKPRSYIVNGNGVALGEFPFIVLIKLRGNTVCGGAIINENWVITAAHCFKGREDQLRKFSFHVGLINLKSGDVYYGSKVIVHPKFTFDTMNSDVALIRMRSPIIFNQRVGSICLPTQMYSDPFGTLTVAGWGRLYQAGPPSNLLQKVSLPIITDQKCSNMYADQRVLVFRSNFCTFLSGYDTCEGDSGGPGFQYINNRAILLGVVSFGWECADTHPGAFTQLSYFLDWIEANMY